MILTLIEVKDFLRIDYADDDSYLELLIKVAEEYLKNSTGQVFDNTNSLAKLFCMVLISDMYDNRQFTIDKLSEKVRFTINSILTQLAYCYILAESGEIPV